MRRLTITLLTVLTLALGAGLAHAAPAAPGDLVLSPPDGMKETKTHVAFSHAGHAAVQLDCVQCHHTWDGKGDILKCSSSGCHDQPGKKGAEAFYAAFHSKKSDASCVACHKAAKSDGNTKAPVSCKQCHPK